MFFFIRRFNYVDLVAMCFVTSCLEKERYWTAAAVFVVGAIISSIGERN